ncbi:antimicrobial peptide system SdpA family protein [Streptacidiphilus sp. MAP12-33]
MTAQRGTATASRSAQGFCFTAALLLVMLLASSTQLVPARLLPGWLQAERESTRVVWPQGWSFFAEQPTTETSVALFVGHGGRLTAAPQLQMASATDWGLSRSAYARYVELANLTGQIAVGDWLDCSALTPADCRAAALRAPVVRTVNHTARPSICGHILLSAQTPVRWTANTRLWQSDWKILRIANGEIACNG